MDQRKHWDEIGSSYGDAIFDVFASDTQGIILKNLDRVANRNGLVIDFGCGTGKAFAWLAPRFGKVYAADISGSLIKQARKRPFSNIEFQRADLSKKNLNLPSADVVFSCNVIMLPEPGRNQSMLNNIAASLKPGGHALLIIPALESLLFTSWRLVDWYASEGVQPKDIPNSEFAYFKGTKSDLARGLCYIDGVPTKHFSAPELEVMTQRAGLKLTSLEKVTYDWATEFTEPPAWMKDPFPWDWLAICKKP